MSDVTVLILLFANFPRKVMGAIERKKKLTMTVICSVWFIGLAGAVLKIGVGAAKSDKRGPSLLTT